MGEESFIRWGISKLKNASHHNSFIRYIFSMEDCRHKMLENETYIAEMGIKIGFGGIAFNVFIST